MASVCSGGIRPSQSNVTMDLNASKVALEDCICPICMCILIEPVTMPCQHELCMPCFKQNVEEASLTCPMCRTRISVWARQAARNHSLINTTRWQQIQYLFPTKVQRRLEGKDDDSSEEVFSVRRPQIAEPGEIRKEYEEQLRKMREQRRKEQEASERLIRELQEEEERKQQERKQSLKSLESQDHDLAQELSQVINEAGTDVPINFLMQESQSRLTQSNSANSNPDRNPSTLESFLERLKEKAQNKNGDPYPFPCLTPSEKEDSGSKRESSSASGLLSDKGVVRPETLTVSSSSVRSLQDMFSPVSSVVPVSEGRSSDCTIISTNDRARSTCNKSVEVLLAKECPPPSTSATQHKSMTLLEDILQAPDRNPLHYPKYNARRTSESASGSAEKHLVAHAEKRRRCPSTESNDSISPEISHFKPIQSCPRTPPRKVDGKLIDPPVVWLTPRNLNQTRLKSSATHSHALKFDDNRSPAMQRRLRVLAEDRRRHVEANSKSTSTLPSEQSQKQAYPVKQRHFTLSDSHYCASPLSFALQAKPTAPCTISSETQLDVNSNESPCSSNSTHHLKVHKNNNIPLWLNGVALERATISPDMDSAGVRARPVLPLVSCVDDFDELDGSPPLPNVSFEDVKTSLSDVKRDATVSGASLSAYSVCPPQVSRNLFQTNVERKEDIEDRTTRVESDARVTPISKKSEKRKTKCRSNNNLEKRVMSPQMSLKDMFKRVQETNNDRKDLGLSPCFASACSTPLGDEGTVQMKSLIDQALYSLEREDTNGDSLPVQLKKSLSSECLGVSTCFWSEPVQKNSMQKGQGETNDKPTGSEIHQQKINKVAGKGKALKAKGKAGKGKAKCDSTNTLDRFMQKLEDATGTIVHFSASKMAESCLKKKKKKIEDPDYVPDVRVQTKNPGGTQVTSYLNDIEYSSDSDFENFSHSQRTTQLAKVSSGKCRKESGKSTKEDMELKGPTYQPVDNDITPGKTSKKSGIKCTDFGYQSTGSDMTPLKKKVRKSDAELEGSTYQHTDDDATPVSSLKKSGKNHSELIDPTSQPTDSDTTPEKTRKKSRKKHSEFVDPTYQPTDDVTPVKKRKKSRKNDAELVGPTYQPTDVDTTPEKTGKKSRKKYSEFVDSTYQPTDVDATPEKTRKKSRRKYSEFIDPTYQPTDVDTTPEKTRKKSRKKYSEIIDPTYQPTNVDTTPEKTRKKSRQKYSELVDPTHPQPTNNDMTPVKTREKSRKRDPELEVTENDTPEKTPKKCRKKTSEGLKKFDESAHKKSPSEPKVDTEVTPGPRMSGRKRRKPFYFYDEDTDEEVDDKTFSSRAVAKLSKGKASESDCLKRPPLPTVRKADLKTDIAENILVLSSQVSQQKASVWKGSPAKKSKTSPSKGTLKVISESSCSHGITAPKSDKENNTQANCVATHNRKRTKLTSVGTKELPESKRDCANLVKPPKTDKSSQLETFTQEELDRELALQLQKQFELEARMSRTKVDRSKGSSDEYSLRRRGKTLLSPVASHTRNRKSTK